MANTNFMVDIGLQTPVANLPIGVPPYLTSINQAIKQPEVNKEPEYKKWGLFNQDEYDLMVQVKEQGGSADDFTYLLEDFRRNSQPNINATLKEEGFLSKASDVVAPVKQTFDSAIEGVLVGGVEGVGNALNFANELAIKSQQLLDGIIPGDQSKQAENQKKLGMQIQSFSQGLQNLISDIGVGEEGVAKKVGEVGGQIGAAFIGGPTQLGAKATTKLGNLGTKATVGAIEGAKGGIVGGGDISSAIEGATIGAIANPLIEKVGDGVKLVGKGIFKSAFTPTTREAELILQDKAGLLKKKLQTRADTAFEEGITGTQTNIGVQGIKKASELWNKQIQPKLDTTKQTINKSEIFTQIKSNIDEITDPSRKKALEKAFDRMIKEAKDLEDDIPLNTAQKIKSEIDKFTPKKKFKGEDISQEFKEVRAQFADKLRGGIHNKLTAEFGEDSAKQYATWNNLRELQDIGVQGIKSGNLEGALTQPGGTATLISNLWNTLTSPIKTIGGKTLYDIGDIFTISGKAGAKTLGEIITNLE